MHTRAHFNLDGLSIIVPLIMFLPRCGRTPEAHQDWASHLLFRNRLINLPSDKVDQLRVRLFLRLPGRIGRIMCGATRKTTAQA